MNESQLWSWRTDTELVDGAPGIQPLINDKEYSIILWDASYRENLLALECLGRQTIRDKVNFIFIEWTDKPNPEVLKYDFIDVYCMNLPKDEKTYPSYDTGIQLNLGLYLARTEWVTYLHCDFISNDQLEIILNKGKLVDKDIIYMEGYQINIRSQKKGNMAEFEQLVCKYGSNIDPYKYKEFGKFAHNKPYANGVLLTHRRNEFIRTTGGFFWNHTQHNEVWNMCALQRLSGLTPRMWLVEHGKALVAQSDMITYQICHGREKRKIVNRLLPYGGVRYFEDFVNDWLPRHKITHYQVSKP